jgi:transglutaminase-like putative cysteine protease
MNRRDFLRLSSVAGALSACGLGLEQTAHAQSLNSDWRSFELTTDIQVKDPGKQAQVWVPVPFAQDTDYQRGAQTTWKIEGNGTAKLVQAPGYGVQMLAVQWADAPGTPRGVVVTSRVQTRNRRVDLSQPPSPHAPRESRETLRHYLRATALLPTDGIVKSTADQITRGKHGNLEKARAIYDWVVDNTQRVASTPGCGVGDVRYMLTTNNMGGKCADISALFVALSRAAGVPARDAYGIRVADSQLGYKSLGKAGDITKAQHCRAEFYAEGYGWVPVDPADVRKVMLEEPPGNRTMDDAMVRASRVMLFGGWEMNWVAYNHGHDITLPGSKQPAVPFLMYPNGETSDGRFDSLDAAAFRYQISSRQLSI